MVPGSPQPNGGYNDDLLCLILFDLDQSSREEGLEERQRETALIMTGTLPMGDCSERTSRGVGGSGVRQRGLPGACPITGTDGAQLVD